MTVNRPAKEEILEGVVMFLKEKLAPKLKGSTRFQALISASLLEIVLREIALDPEEFFKQEELDRLLGSDVGKDLPLAEKESILCERIREGGFDEGEARKALLDYLKKELQYKIQIDNPKW